MIQSGLKHHHQTLSCLSDKFVVVKYFQKAIFWIPGQKIMEPILKLLNAQLFRNSAQLQQIDKQKTFKKVLNTTLANFYCTHIR